MFRIVVSIFRGTTGAEALKLMAQGIQVEKDTFIKASEVVDKYLEAATAILDHVDDDFVLGIIQIIDLKTKEIKRSSVIHGLNK